MNKYIVIILFIQYALQLSYKYEYKYKKEDVTEVISSFYICLGCDSHGARTHDPNIKSVVLYQLS